MHHAKEMNHFGDWSSSVHSSVFCGGVVGRPPKKAPLVILLEPTRMELNKNMAPSTIMERVGT